MDPRDLVLTIVGACPGGRVEGRTILQKIGYFCSTIFKQNIRYQPHYFGPYSTEIADAVSDLVAIRALKETYSVTPWGNVRHDYELTEDGKVLFRAALRSTEVRETKKLVDRIAKQPGWDNTQMISCAAKVDYILSKSDRPMTNTAIREEARHLGWKLDDKTINQVSSFLQALGLIEGV